MRSWAIPGIAIELPELPPEMAGGEFGTQRCRGKVGLLKRALYGLRDSPRLWQQANPYVLSH